MCFPISDCCEARLVNFTLQAFPSSGANPNYTYTDPGGPAQDIYSVVPSPRIGFAMKAVKIDTSKNNLGILTLCEVLIFGVKLFCVQDWLRLITSYLQHGRSQKAGQLILSSKFSLSVGLRSSSRLVTSASQAAARPPGLDVMQLFMTI
ncbi:hypothetical protein PoB_000553800 [Plakobranchus ocellatus]|uniref:Uncharacterized protein n=1 Tax=Plakobranchus ocellatus TaxID=259542 RepID=A0AAV3Y9B6_9GAST|nr:hypothetical protein PoB_000553800 [Plakobranchus ocellatus]